MGSTRVHNHSAAVFTDYSLGAAGRLIFANALAKTVGSQNFLPTGWQDGAKTVDKLVMNDNLGNKESRVITVPEGYPQQQPSEDVLVGDSRPRDYDGSHNEKKHQIFRG